MSLLQAQALPAETLILIVRARPNTKRATGRGRLVAAAVLLSGTGPVPGKAPQLNELNRLFDLLGLYAKRPVLVMDDEGVVGPGA